jgi:hypothetical protein
MRARTWLLTTTALIVTAAADLMALNLWLDVYGVYRDTHHRRLAVYGDERVAKYLLSGRYVPENFSALLVGSSVSGNWNVADTIQGLRVYNESLLGGNVVEERCLLDQAFSRPGIKVVFLIVHPFLTHSHEFESIRLTPRLKLSSLGSESLWNAYVEMFKICLHHARQAYNEFGALDYGTAKHELNATLKQMMRPGTDFEIDPVAWTAYLDLIREVRAHHVKLVLIVPPISEELFETKRAAFAKYLRLVQAQLAPGEELIDFTSGQYAEFRKNADNFNDGVHMGTQAAAVVVSMMNAALMNPALMKTAKLAQADGKLSPERLERVKQTANAATRFDALPGCCGLGGAFGR